MKNDRFIYRVLEKTGCTKHHAKKSEPCFRIPTLGKTVFVENYAICNYRAKAAGFNAKINPHSLRRSRG